MMNWLTRHFQRYRQRKPWAFCWMIAVEGLIVSLVCAFVLSLLFPELGRDFPDWGPITIFLVIVVFAPLAETLLLQSLPIYIAKKFKAPFAFQVITSMSVFGGLHFLDGIVAGIAAGLVGGFYFAFTYAHWRQKSRWTSFWVTALSHALHNAGVFALLALSSEL